MKKIFLLLLFLVSPLWPVYAQTTYTPNLNLALPPAAPNTWGAQYNTNFEIIDGANAAALTCTQGQIQIWGINGWECGNLSAGSFGADVSFSGDITPPQISANTDNYNPTGLSTASTLRLSTDASRNLTGIVGGVDGRLLLIHNVGSFDLVLKNDTTSTLGNRFLLGADITLPSNRGIIVQYDSTSQRWRAASGISGGGGGQAADNDLTALAGLSGTGAPYRTGTDTWVQRSLTGTSGNIVITNPDGIAGPPTFDVGATIVQMDSSATYTAGDHNFGSANSLKLPTSAGAAPTTSGICAYNTTTNRYLCGVNGSTITLAPLSEVQPLDTDLTQIAAIVPINNQYLLWRSSGNSWTAKSRADCSGANQAINFDGATGNEGCVTFSGSISGLNTGNIPKAASSSTLTNSIMSEAASVVTVAGGFVAGVSPFLTLDTSAIASSDKVWTVQNTAGLIIPCDTTIGNYTNDHVLKVVKVGSIVTCADGGAAGTGTWTDSSTNTGTNKTLNAEGTGNVFTSVSVTQLDFASCVGGTASNQWDDDATGLTAPTATCNDTGNKQIPSADFSGSATNALTRTIHLPKGHTGNIDINVEYVTNANSPTGNTRWEFSTSCSSIGGSWDRAFNPAQGVTDAVLAQGSDRWINKVTQNALTLTNCAAEDDMTIRVARIGGDGADTNNDVAKALRAYVTIRWVQQSQ